jgi:hypothetical protein
MRGRGTARELADGTKAVAEVIAAAAKAMVARERVMIVQGITKMILSAVIDGKEFDCIEACEARRGRNEEIAS